MKPYCKPPKTIKHNLEANAIMLCSVYHIGVSIRCLFVRNETYGKMLAWSAAVDLWAESEFHLWLMLYRTHCGSQLTQCHITRTNADMHNPHNPFFFFCVCYGQYDNKHVQTLDA